MIDYLINIILELLDPNILVAYIGTLILNLVLHLYLSCIQLINNSSQRIVERIELLQPLIHSISLILHPTNLILSGSDITFQFLNLVVQHKLKFLELLRPLL